MRPVKNTEFLTDRQVTQIKIKLLKMDWNQTRLAKEMGVTRQYLSQMLRKKVSNPPRAKQIFEIFGEIKNEKNKD